ncbi:MAG: hypothetical protein E6I06_02945 [Chloroflexi bacterium]|nr:MAG: hypothetical protein E6I06_02945 [Chloroflexota bacterium]
MKISLVSADAAELNVDALAIPVATGQRLSGAALELDRVMGGVLSEMVVNAEFRGRIHEVLPMPAQGKISPRRVILYGLGAPHDLDGQRMRSAHHELVRGGRSSAVPGRPARRRSDARSTRWFSPALAPGVSARWWPPRKTAKRRTVPGNGRTRPPTSSRRTHWRKRHTGSRSGTTWSTRSSDRPS